MLTRKAWVDQLLTALEQEKIRTVDLDDGNHPATNQLR